MLRTGPRYIAITEGCSFTPPDARQHPLQRSPLLSQLGSIWGFFSLFYVHLSGPDLGCSELLLPSQMGTHPALLTCSSPDGQQQDPGAASLSASIHWAQGSFFSSALMIPPGDCRQKPNCMT